MTDFESTEDLRHSFYGIPSNSVIDGSQTLLFSNDEKFKRIKYSITIIGSKILFIIICFSSIFYFKYYSVYVSQNEFLNNYGSFAGDILNAILIQFLSSIYATLSQK
jgi:hypothetical protein